MVGIDTHIVILQVEGVLAELDMFEFIFVEIRPAPQPCINHMRETFPPCHLQSSVQCSLNGDALAWMDTICGDGSDERVQLILLLLQLLHKAFNGSLGKALILSTLPVAHEAMDDAEASIIAAGRVYRHDAGIKLVSQCVTRKFSGIMMAQL